MADVELFCPCCRGAQRSRPPLSDAEKFKRRYPVMGACFDRDLYELAELDNVEFMVVGSYKREYDVRVHHWPIRGWTVSARWNKRDRCWDRCKTWPTPEQIQKLKKREAERLERMPRWRICTYDRGVVIMDDAEYLQTVQRFLRVLIDLVEVNGLADDPVVERAKSESTDLLTLQRSLCGLIQLAKANGLNDNEDVNEAKELIRCSVLGCGLAGACNGVGLPQYPCPLRT